MKHAEALLIGILIATLTGLSYGATVTPGSDRTNIDHGPATLDDDFELKQSQGKRTVTTYPAGTTSSARGGDTVSLTSTDFCGTGTNAIVCTGTDSKVSTAVLPTNVVTSTATGTSTANVLPKMDGNGGLTLSRLFDNGTDIGIGTTAPLGKIELRFSGFNRLNPLNSYLNPLNSVMIHDIENGPNQGAGLTFASYDTVDLSYVGKIVNTRIADSTSRRLDFIIRPGVNTATFATSDIKLSILDNGNATLYGQMSVTGETLRGSTSGSISRKASATGGATTLVEPSAPPAAVGQVLAVSSLATTGTATNTATLSWKAVLGEDATLSTRPPLAIASTGTITETVTNTDTGTNTGTGTVSGSATATATNTATATASATRSGSDTFTRTNTFTTTGTYTFSGTGNGVDAFSVTLTTTTTGTVTGTATVTMTGTATATAGSGTGTVTSTVSATSTATSSATATQTVMSPGTADRYTITRAKTATSTGTVTLTEYVTISLTGTNTASGSGTVTATVTGTTTATATGTASGTWSGTSTSTVTQTTTGSSTNAAVGRIADGLTISGGGSTYTLPIAGTTTGTGTSTATLGGIKVGSGLTRSADGTVSISPVVAPDVPGGDRFLIGGSGECERGDVFEFDPHVSCGDITGVTPAVGAPVVVFDSSTGHLALVQGTGWPSARRWVSAGTVKYELWAKTTSAAELKLFLSTCDAVTGSPETSIGTTTTIPINGSSWTLYSASAPIGGTLIPESKTICLSIGAYTYSGTPSIDIAANGPSGLTLRVNGPWILPQ